MKRKRVKRRGAVKRVLLHLELAFASQRDILFGINACASRRAFWNIVIMNGERDSPPLSVPANGSFDGIITTLPLDSEISRSDIPLVVIGSREPWLQRRMRNLAFVRNDDRKIGFAVAQKFLSMQHYASFAFVGSHAGTYCPALREEGFRAGLGPVKERKIQTYPRNDLPDGSPEDVAALGEWLESLPKPAAVMAVHDLRATQVLSAANAKAIPIPDDVSVIGVDNDEILCEFTDPPLTSVAPDHVLEGELAAETLLSIMNGDKNRSITRKSCRFEIAERESTSAGKTSQVLAKAAMAFIRRNYRTPIGAEDVARSVRASSRRLVDMRFGETYGISIHEAILRLRYEELKRRLVRTKAPIGKLMTACGFSDAANAKRIFRKRFGMSMREWRSAAAGKPQQQ